MCIRDSADFVGEVAAAIEQTAEQFADGRIALQNQNRSRAGKAQRFIGDGRRLNQTREGAGARRVSEAGPGEMRLDRIDLNQRAWHDQDRSERRLRGYLEGGAPDAIEAHAARAAAEGREKEASADDVEERPAIGGAHFNGAARGARCGRGGDSAHSPNQRAEGPFAGNDIWNTSHAGRNSWEAVPMIVVAFKTKC